MAAADDHHYTTTSDSSDFTSSDDDDRYHLRHYDDDFQYSGGEDVHGGGVVAQGLPPPVPARRHAKHDKRPSRLAAHKRSQSGLPPPPPREKRFSYGAVRAAADSDAVASDVSDFDFDHEADEEENTLQERQQQADTAQQQKQKEADPPTTRHASLTKQASKHRIELLKNMRKRRSNWALSRTSAEAPASPTLSAKGNRVAQSTVTGAAPAAETKTMVNKIGVARAATTATATVALAPAAMAAAPAPPSPTGKATNPAAAAAKGKSKSKRQRVLQEILQTEHTFVNNLSAFHKGYVEAISQRDTPLKRELLASGEIALLFSNIEQIITLNTDFLKRLESTMSSWPDESGGDGPNECVGEFFTSVAPLFALYAQYTSNHDLAVDVLKNEFDHREDYLALMKVCETEAQSILTQVTGRQRPPQLVGFYLIMPVQRVPRYKMLLQELLKRTPEGHRDLETLPDAVAEVDKAAHKINETIRAREEKQKVIELASRFLGTGGDGLAAAGRKLEFEGSLVKVCRRDLREYHFHLFTDILTYSKRKGANSFKLHRRLDLAATTVKDVSDEEAGRNKVQHAFQIVSQTKSFMVSARSAADKQRWIECIVRGAGRARAQVADLAHRRGSSAHGQGGVAAAVWAADGTQDGCTFCKIKCNMVRRRHHCRSCGALVCASCSPHRLLLRNIDPVNPVRICDNCANAIELRLQRAARVEVEVHAMFPDGGGGGAAEEKDASDAQQQALVTKLNTCPVYVKVYENDMFIGITSFAMPGLESTNLVLDDGGIAIGVPATPWDIVEDEEAHDNGGDRDGKEGEAMKKNDSDNDDNKPEALPEALPTPLHKIPALRSTAAGVDNLKGNNSALSWHEARFEFEVDHLARGTDDAGVPHRIFFELFVCESPTASSPAPGDILVGVGSLSALDVLLNTQLMRNGSREGRSSVRRVTMEAKKPSRRSLFKASRPTSPSSAGDGSETEEASTSLRSLPSRGSKRVLTSTSSHRNLRSSKNSMVPNTPMYFRSAKSLRAQGLSTLPFSLVRLVQPAINMGDHIAVVGKLAVSAVIAPPLEVRESESRRGSPEAIAWATRDILRQLIPTAPAVVSWKMRRPQNVACNVCASDADDSLNTDGDSDAGNGSDSQGGEGKISSENLRKSWNARQTASFLKHHGNEEKPGHEVFASHHCAELMLKHAIREVQNHSSPSGYSQSPGKKEQTVCDTMSSVLRSLREDDSWHALCMRTLRDWRGSHNATTAKQRKHGSEGRLSPGALAALSERGRAVYQIVFTEKQYVAALERLDEHFVQPFLVRNAASAKQGGGAGASSPKLKTVGSFSGRTDASSSEARAAVLVCLQTVTQLKTLHQELLATLEVRIAAGEEEATGGAGAPQYSDTVCIGDLFERFGVLFRLYTQYMQNYDLLMDSVSAQEGALPETLVSFRMELFAQGAPMKDETGKDMALAHLLRPMQRMLRYTRLLSTLLERTDKNHKDHASLVKAVAQLDEAHNDIQHTIRERENKDQILRIESEFVDRNQKFLQKGRMFVRKGPLTKVCRREDKEFFFWLFTDLLVYGHSVAGGRYKFHRSLDLKSVRVTNPTVHPISQRPCFTIASKHKSFVVYVQAPDGQTVWSAASTACRPADGGSAAAAAGATAGAADRLERGGSGRSLATDRLLRDAWYADIQELTSGGSDSLAVARVSSNRDFLAPVWQTDKSTKHCQLCGIGFTLTRRRHHCRVCGRLVCASCSPHRLVIQSIDPKKKVRVCNPCKHEVAENTD